MRIYPYFTGRNSLFEMEPGTNGILAESLPHAVEGLREHWFVHRCAVKGYRTGLQNDFDSSAIGQNPARRRHPETRENRAGETSYAPLSRKLRRRRQTLWHSMPDLSGASPARRSIGFHEVVCRLAFWSCLKWEGRRRLNQAEDYLSPAWLAPNQNY
jgi:hypothetical protein